MSVFGLLRLLLWLSSVATTFPAIPHSAVFSRLLISQVLKPSGCSFKRIWWHDPCLVLHRVDCGTDWEIIGSWSISMGPAQVARQRALPQTEELPAPHRRFDRVCAKGYFGRKRGQVGRTRTTVLQPYTHQWLGTFSGPGNGKDPRRITTGSPSHHGVCGGVCTSTLAHHCESGWIVWKHGSVTGDPFEPVWGDWTEQAVCLA